MPILRNDGTIVKSQGNGIGEVAILVERTLNELNIDVSTLSRGSGQNILVKCKNCSMEFLRRFNCINNKHSCNRYKLINNVQYKWCHSCGDYRHPNLFYHVTTLRNGFSVYCKTCAGNSERVKNSNRNRTLIGWMGLSLNKIKTRCAKKNRAFNIDVKYMTKVWNQQRGKCYYSNISMVFGIASLRSASIDRIDSSRGYVRGNVVWASQAMNYLKGRATISELRVFLHEMDINSALGFNT
jgi:hypothetical protein